MVWKLTKDAQQQEPIAGVPWREMDDDEFRQVAKAYADREGFPLKSLENSGWFEHVENKPSEKKES